ncbi:MAG: hypothetical protein OEV41_09705, partial [Gammaproteobacteria bacterium]|nr:hypothetical protein [Gammaproteobacteria bacterium]
WGDDLLNADDDHSTSGGLNDAPDTHPSYEDRAFGGAGRDRLIANTGGDRLIDWAGEFNSYIVPFAPFGLGTVSRALQPQIAEFLYALSASDGADFTRGGDPARNGEPFGELGLVRQQDFAWQDQTGAPDDPQPGNIPGGARDVLRSASFDDASAVAGTGFFVDSGTFTATGGELRVAAESLGGDAVAVYGMGEQLPGYFEIQASVKMDKAVGGWKANAYVIFDYQNEQDFKYVGIDDSLNKLVIGHRDASGWHVDEQAVVKGGLKADKYYNMLVAINGVNVTLVVDNKEVFQHTYAPRVVDGYAYGLNYGYVGVGSDNARGSFDNIRLQILPPQVTFDDTDDFSGADTGEFFTGGSSGVWGFNGGRYTVDPGASLGTSMLDLGPDNLNFNSYLELNAKVKTSDQAGFIFDRYGDDSFKFVVIDENSQKLIIGHYTKKAGWVEDASVSTTISATKDYTLGLTLKGSTVSATLSANGGGFQAMLGHVFNSATVDGTFGLLAKDGSASFDDVRVKTNDDAFVPASGGSMNAADTVTLAGAEPSDLTQAQLDSIATVAIAQWMDALGNGDPRLASLGDVRISVANLAGDELGHTEGSAIQIDTNAAGRGWFVDLSPTDSSEFTIRVDRNVLTAAPGSDAFGRVDLLTVVTHEIGHLLGFDHDDALSVSVMDDDLDPGVRYVLNEIGLDGDPDAPITDADLMKLARKAAEWEATSMNLAAGSGSGTPRFDFDAGQNSGGVRGGIDWQAGGNGWNSSHSPFVSGDAGKSAGSNFSDFLLKLFKRDDTQSSGDQGSGYDELGKSLVGKPSDGPGKAGKSARV